MRNSDWNHAVGSAVADDVRDERPRWKTDAKTHDYWSRTLTSAVKRLKVKGRARDASGYRRRYGLHEDRQGRVNAISRKLEVKSGNTITDRPECTPQFRDADEEIAWFAAVKGYADQALKGQGIVKTLRELLKDNYYGGIAWGKLEYQTRFSAGTPIDATRHKLDALGERERIAAENQQVATLVLPTISDTDHHDLHLADHVRQRDEWVELVEAIGEANPDAQVINRMIRLLEVHISDHRHQRIRVTEEQVRFTRWPPFLIYYDPDALTWDDCEWYAIEMLERIEVLKQDDQLDNRVLAKLEGLEGVDYDVSHERRRRGRDKGADSDVLMAGEEAGDAGPVHGTQDSDAPRERWVRYYIIHDRLEGQMIVVAEHERAGQKPLAVMDWPFPGDMVRPLVLNPVADQVAGVSECKRLEVAHAKLESVRAKIDEFITSVPAAKLLLSEALSNREDVVRNLMDPQKLAVFLPTDALEAYKELHWPKLDATLVEYQERLENELDSIAGIPEFAQAEQTGETATATAARDRQMGHRIADDKEAIAGLIEWYLGEMINVLREFGTVEQLVRIVGDEGKDWSHFTPADLPDGITWLVDADSLSPTKRELEKKQLLEMVTAVQPWIDPTPIMDARAFLARIVRQFDGPEDLSEVFRAPGAGMGQPMPPGGMPGGGGGGGQEGMEMQAGMNPADPAMAPQGVASGAALGAAAGI